MKFQRDRAKLHKGGKSARPDSFAIELKIQMKVRFDHRKWPMKFQRDRAKLQKGGKSARPDSFAIELKFHGENLGTMSIHRSSFQTLKLVGLVGTTFLRNPCAIELIF